MHPSQPQEDVLTRGGSWSLKDAKILTPEEVERLMGAAKRSSERDHMLMVLAYNGAMRVSELVHIRICDFNFNTGKLSIIPLKKAGQRRVKGVDGNVRIVERELPNAVDYPMPVVVMTLVSKYIEKNGYGGRRENSSDWLFPGRTRSCRLVKRKCHGGHISKREVQLVFDRLTTKLRIKIPGRGIHSLKHARLTEVARKSKDPYLVRDLGRHSSIAISDHYVHYVNLKEKVDEIGGQL